MKAKQYIKKFAVLVGLLDHLMEIQARVRSFKLATLASNLRYRIMGAPDHLPIPPAHLIYLAIGSTNISSFLKSGRVHAFTLILKTLQKHDFSIDEFDNVLDFG